MIFQFVTCLPRNSNRHGPLDSLSSENNYAMHYVCSLVGCSVDLNWRSERQCQQQTLASVSRSVAAVQMNQPPAPVRPPGPISPTGRHITLGMRPFVSNPACNPTHTVPVLRVRLRLLLQLQLPSIPDTRTTTTYSSCIPRVYQTNHVPHTRNIPSTSNSHNAPNISTIPPVTKRTGSLKKK